MIEVKKSLKKIMGGNDPLEVIFYGTPTEEHFRDAAKDFERMDNEKR